MYISVTGGTLNLFNIHDVEKKMDKLNSIEEKTVISKINSKIFF